MYPIELCLRGTLVHSNMVINIIVQRQHQLSKVSNIHHPSSIIALDTILANAIWDAPEIIMKTLSNHSIMLPRLSALLVLIGFCEHCTQIKSFSPSLINSHAIRNSHDRGLFMSVEPSSDLTGKVVAHRSLFRFSPTESSIQTPYTIEERQYFSVTQDKSLEPISTKSLIFRGVGSNDNDVKSEWSWRMDSDTNESSKKSMPRDFTRVGPALHTINGLQEDDDRAWDDKFAIALYCMQHPEIINGEGIEVGR